MRNKYSYEIIFVLLAVVAIFSGVSLLTFDPSDPSYSNIIFSRLEEPVSNIFGIAGSYTADWLGILLGWNAFLIPLFMLYLMIHLVRVYRKKISAKKAWGSAIAFMLFIFLLSAISALSLQADPFFYDKMSGGLLGVTIASILQPVLGKIGAIVLCSLMALLCIHLILRISIMDMINKVVKIIDNIELNNADGGKEKLKTANNKRSIDNSMYEYDTNVSLPMKILNGIAAKFGKISMSMQQRSAKRRAEKDLQEQQELEIMLAKAEGRKPLLISAQPSEPVLSEPQASEYTNISEGEFITLSELEQMMEGDSHTIGMTVSELESIMETAGESAPEVTPEAEPLPSVQPQLTEQTEIEHTEEIVPTVEPEIMVQSEPVADIEPLEIPQITAIADESLSMLTTPEQVIEHSPTDEIEPDPIEYIAKPSTVVHAQYKNYELDMNMLDLPSDTDEKPDMTLLHQKADALIGKLRDFGVDGQIREIRPGPVVTLFELEPAPGIKISKIASLENDLALAMSAISIRIIAPIPGKGAVGIEVPNEYRSTVKLRELIDTDDFKLMDSPLEVALGKDISGKPYYTDLRTMPHLLVAGTTGSGKSVCINTIICSILYKSSPERVKFVMIDPKMVELNIYNNIPHLAAPVVTDTHKAAAVLNNVVKEMEARYKLLSECNVRNIDSYSKYIETHPELEPMPYMVVIVDEFGDLMMVAGKEVENAIIRIAQLARAVGIHLVLATQRPSVNVITGIIKANMPARISFRVSSKIDSRTILDQNGAELLLGKGDSLFVPPGTSFTTRIHGCFVSEEEVKGVVDNVKQYGEPSYNMALMEDNTVSGDIDSADLDSRYEEAINIAREKGSVSISMIQRYLRIGYNRAARIVETMEIQGLIAPSDGTSKPRDFLG